MKRYIIVFFVYAFLCNSLQLAAQTVGINFFKGSWAEVLDKAHAEGKYIFVEFYGDYCLYCKNMDTLVFRHPDVYVPYNQHFVNYKINFSEENMDLSYYDLANSYSEDLSFNILPVLLYFDSEGNLLRKESGGKTISVFAEIANQVTTNPYENGILAHINKRPATDTYNPNYKPNYDPMPSQRVTAPGPTTQKVADVQSQPTYYTPAIPQNQQQTQSRPTVVITAPTQPQNTQMPTNQPRFNSISDVRSNSSVAVIPPTMERDYTRLNELSHHFSNSHTTTNPNIVREYAYLLKKLQKAFNAVVNYYLELEKDRLNNDGNREFIYDFAVNLENKAMDYFVSDIQYYKTSRGGDKVNEKTKNAIEYTVLTAIREKDRKLFAKAEDVINKSFLPNREAFLFEMRSLYYQGIEDWNAYAKMVSKYMEQHTISDPIVLNDIALKFQRNVNDKKMLRKAILWIQESIRIENEFYNNFTYALLLVRIDDIQKAKSAAKNAIFVANMRNDTTDTLSAEQLLDRLAINSFTADNNY